jgi:hypothetical protein
VQSQFLHRHVPTATTPIRFLRPHLPRRYPSPQSLDLHLLLAQNPTKSTTSARPLTQVDSFLAEYQVSELTSDISGLSLTDGTQRPKPAVGTSSAAVLSDLRMASYWGVLTQGNYAKRLCRYENKMMKQGTFSSRQLNWVSCYGTRKPISRR